MNSIIGTVSGFFIGFISHRFFQYLVELSSGAPKSKNDQFVIPNPEKPLQSRKVVSPDMTFKEKFGLLLLPEQRTALLTLCDSILKNEENTSIDIQDALINELEEYLIEIHDKTTASGKNAIVSALYELKSCIRIKLLNSTLLDKKKRLMIFIISNEDYILGRDEKALKILEGIVGPWEHRSWQDRIVIINAEDLYRIKKRNYLLENPGFGFFISAA